MKIRKDVKAPSVPVSVEPRLLGVKAAASYMSVTVWFVRSLYWSRAVPALKLGKRILFDKSDLDQYIESQKSAAA